MSEVFESSAYLGVLISLGSYALGMWLRKKTGLSFMNPLLISCWSFSGLSYNS